MSSTKDTGVPSVSLSEPGQSTGSNISEGGGNDDKGGDGYKSFEEVYKAGARSTLSSSEQSAYDQYMANWRKNSGSSSSSSTAYTGKVKMPTTDTSYEYPTLSEAPEAPTLKESEYYDKTSAINSINKELELAQQQYTQQIDNAVDQNATELQRAFADAQEQYRTQQEQITADEMRALDNSALYAEARGDKGGIGQAQYNSVQNAAAQNRVAIRQAQATLATDISRQISDLRAQGEFDKADALLSLAQTQLSQLRQIEDQAYSYNMSVDQVNNAIKQWEYDTALSAQQYKDSMELSMAQLTGKFSNGTPTYEAQQNTESNLAQIALSLLEAGVSPDELSSAQLSAMKSQYGMSGASIAAYYNAINS